MVRSSDQYGQPERRISLSSASVTRVAATSVDVIPMSFLMHKVAGWDLREIGKRNKEILVNFLNKHCETMPRTILRYAIEKLNGKEKAHYM